MLNSTEIDDGKYHKEYWSSIAGSPKHLLWESYFICS